MKRKIIIVVGIIFVIGILTYWIFVPSESENEKLLGNFSNVIEKERIGSKAKQINNNLPLGYSFEMTYNEIYNVRDSLTNAGFADGPILYKYQIGDSILENVRITFEFDYLNSNSRLEDSKPYNMVIEYNNGTYISDELFEYIRTQMNSQHIGYERVDYLISESKKQKERSEYYPVFKVWSAWFKDNKQIILREDGLKQIFIEYNNLPVQRPIEQDRINRDIEWTQKRIEFNNTMRLHKKEFEKYR